MDADMSALWRSTRGLCFTMSAIPTARYLAARALVSYPACTFRHVFFAGSVVRTSYDWKTLVDAAASDAF